MAILSVLIACKPGKDKEITSEQETVTSPEGPGNTPSGENQNTNPATGETGGNDANSTTGQSSTQPAAPKVCNPNFNPLGQPKKNTYFYYVSSFNPEEFKCWTLLEDHGQQICDGKPCTVIYVDRPNVHFGDKGPDYLDEATLFNYGIGKFVYNGKYWEIKGANQWKRKGKGYGYYNTDNQLGG